MTKILYRNSEKFLSNAKKRASRNIFRHFFHANFFMFVLLISNHTVFLVRFGINLHLWVFQKAEIALAEAALAISAFWKTHSCKLIPNWTRNRMITYTNSNISVNHKNEIHTFPWLILLIGWWKISNNMMLHLRNSMANTKLKLPGRLTSCKI